MQHIFEPVTYTYVIDEHSCGKSATLLPACSNISSLVNDIVSDICTECDKVSKPNFASYEEHIQDLHSETFEAANCTCGVSVSEPKNFKCKRCLVNKIGRF